MKWRVAVATLGVGLMVWGTWGLFIASGHPDHRLRVLTQVVAAAALHDAVLAPAALAVAWALSRLLGRVRARRALAILGVCAATTLLAVPVLGRFGARQDNPSLLPRQYVSGLVLVLAVEAVATLLLLRRRSTKSVRRAP